MKYFIALILFSACGQSVDPPKWQLTYDSVKDQTDISFVDKSGDYTTIKVNWEDSTATIIDHRSRPIRSKQTTRIRLKNTPPPLFAVEGLVVTFGATGLTIPLIEDTAVHPVLTHAHIDPITRGAFKCNKNK